MKNKSNGTGSHNSKVASKIATAALFNSYFNEALNQTDGLRRFLQRDH